MEKYVYTPLHIKVGEAVWTKDRKPGLSIKKPDHNFYDVVALEDVVAQVYEILGIKK